MNALKRRVRAFAQPQEGEPRRLPFGVGRGITLSGDPSLSLDLWFGFFESELGPFIRESCRPGCVDIGSYDGYYALVFAKLGGAPVRTYDINPAAQERVRRNLELNPALAGAIELRQAGVGTGEGDTVSLDDDLEGWGRVGFLKVDVEGAEDGVLAGAERVLAEDRPHVVVETHSADLERRCAERLMGNGYRPRVVTQRRFLPQNRATEHNRWLVANGRP